MLLNSQRITEVIEQEIKKIPRHKWQQNHDDSKTMGYSKSSSKKEVYSNKILPQGEKKKKLK